MPPADRPPFWPDNRTQEVHVTPEEKAAQEAADAAAAAEAADAEADAEEAKGAQTFDLKYVQSLRAEAAKYRREAREAQSRAKEFEDASKSEAEKAAERAVAAEASAALAVNEAARLRVALKKGLTADQAKRLVGDDEEALEADADSLLELFGTNDDRQDLSAGGTPRERLKPGAVPDAEPEETDPAKLAALVPRSYN